jgi:hypothetical protein
MLMPLSCHSLSLPLSGHHQHVNELHPTPPRTLVPSLARQTDGNAQTRRVQTMPTTPRSCQSAHEHVSGHDRAHTRPIAVVLLSPFPFARVITTSPAHSQTPPLARRRPVADALVNLCRARTARTLTMPELPRPPFTAPARAVGPP